MIAHLVSTPLLSSSTSLPPQEQRYWALGLLVIPIFTALGNAMVCACVARERSLRTPTNCYIASLAVADLLVAGLVMPLAVYVEVTGGVWSFGDALCDAWIACDVMCCTASIMNLTAICIDRFLAVTRPIRYSRGGLNSTLRVRVSIIVSWSLSAAVASPIVFGINDTPLRSMTPSLCTFYNADFLLCSSVCSFYLPGSVVTFLYWRIFRVLNARRIPNTGPTSGSNRCFVASRPGSSSTFHEPRETSCDWEDQSLANSPGETMMEDAASRQDHSTWIRGRFATMRAILRLPDILETTLTSLPVSDQDLSGLETNQTVFGNVAPNSVLSLKPKLLYSTSENFLHGQSNSPETSSSGFKCILPSKSCSLNSPSGPCDCSLSSKKYSLVPMNDVLPESFPNSSNKASSGALSETCSLTDYTKTTLVSRKPTLPGTSDGVELGLSGQLTAPFGQYLSNKSRTVPPRRNAMAFERRWKSATTSGSTESPKRFRVSRESRNINAMRKRYRKERKINKALAIILGAFFVCWFPFFTANVVNAICIRMETTDEPVCQLDPNVMSAFIWLGYINSFINPVVYTIFNVEFRRAFRKMFTRPHRSSLPSTSNRLLLSNNRKKSTNPISGV